MTKAQKYEYRNFKKRIKKRLKNYRAIELEKLKLFKQRLQKEVTTDEGNRDPVR